MAKRKQRPDDPATKKKKRSAQIDREKRQKLVKEYKGHIARAESWDTLNKIVGSIDKAFSQGAIAISSVDELCEWIAQRAREVGP